MSKPGDQAPKLRVLIVEDNNVEARTMAALVRWWGHEARIAFDGSAALREAAESAPDVVVLDVGLAGTDGYEVAHRLRQLQPIHRPLLIAITANATEADYRRCLEDEITFHLAKPVQP